MKRIENRVCIGRNKVENPEDYRFAWVLRERGNLMIDIMSNCALDIGSKIAKDYYWHDGKGKFLQYELHDIYEDVVLRGPFMAYEYLICIMSDEKEPLSKEAS